MTKETVLVEVSGQVATVILNEPDRRNPLSRETLKALISTIETLEGRADVRAVVLTGAGSAFSSGADMTDPNTHAAEDISSYQEGQGQSIYDVMEASRLPIIVALNGPAVGAGACLAIAADFRIASPEASLSFAQVTIGVMPANGNMVRLARLASISDALDVGLTGRRVSAEEAVRLRLVNRCVPADSLLQEAKLFAELLAKQAPLAVRFAKEALHRGLEIGLREAILADRYPMFLLYQSDDRKEASAAWLENREPKFIGH